jgi:hypothetical protein
MNESYSQFMFTKTYDRYPPFDWSSDGCSIPGKSVPGWVGAVVRSVANLFNQPCQLHDFGYRNYGTGLRLRPNEKTRHWIDNRFYTEMKRECNNKYADFWHKIDGQYEACNGEALLMYKAVRMFGHFG